MSTRVVYGLSQIYGNPNITYNIDVPRGHISLEETSFSETWNSENNLSVKTADPTFELYTAEKCGFASTQNRLLAIANGEVGLAVGQNDTEIDRLQVHSSIIRQYETINVANQNYNITANSPKTYLIEPGTANTNKIIFNDANLNDGTTYSIYNMSNGSVTVESAIDPTILTTLNTGQTTGVTSVSFSADNTRFAVTFQASAGTAIAQIYNTSNLTLVATCSGHTAFITRSAFSPDGTILATCATNNSIRTYNTSNGTQIASFAHGLSSDNYLGDVKFLSNSKIISTSQDQYVRIKNVTTGVDIQSFLLTSPGWGIGLAINNTGDRIVASQGADSNALSLISRDTSTDVMALVAIQSSAHSANVTVVLYIDNFTRIASLGGTTVKIWSASNLDNLQTITLPVGNTHDVFFHLGNLFISDTTCSVSQYDASTYSLVRRTSFIDVPDNSLPSVRFVGDNMHVARSNGLIYVLNNYLANRANVTYDVPGAKFYQNLVNYSANVTYGASFTLPRFSACHIKVCKISNMEIYFFVNMSVNAN